MSRWYRSRIFDDCHLRLLPSENDTGRRFLLVTFFGEQLKGEQHSGMIIFDTELVLIC